MDRWQRHHPPFSARKLRQGRFPGRRPCRRAAQERVSLPWFLYLFASRFTSIVRAALFHLTLHATGNPVRLCPQHDLGDLALLDDTGGAQALKTWLVDLSRVVDKEPQSRDAPFHTLHICLASESCEHFAGLGPRWLSGKIQSVLRPVDASPRPGVPRSKRVMKKLNMK